MNFIDIFLLNLVLVSVPLLIYMVYIITNQNIQPKEKNLFLSLTFMLSYYLITHYGEVLQSDFTSFFTGIIIFFLIYKEMYITSSFLMFLNLLAYHHSFLWISYALIMILVIIKMYRGFNDKTFLFLCAFFYISSFTIWGIMNDISSLEIFFILMMFITSCYIVYLFYQKGIEALKTHLKYQELQKEKQIRLSLFKITHEIKNPIAVIKAYLDMYDTNNLNHSKKYIPIIKGEIDRLLVLLQDFLLVNKNNMNLDIMDLNILIEDVKDNVASLMESNEVNFEIDTIDDELFINGDYNRLCQVLINILKNSVEANPHHILLKVSEDDDNLCIKIEDDGDGIPKEILNKIYEPFYTTKKCGTGLGVSLSKEIITAHQGTLNYTSEEGMGTIVKITLPTYNEL